MPSAGCELGGASLFPSLPYVRAGRNKDIHGLSSDLPLPGIGDVSQAVLFTNVSLNGR